MVSKTNDYIPFTRWHAFFLACSVFTYLVDTTIDIILAVSYLNSDHYVYCLITLCLVIFPTILVEVFSIRWHQMDEVMDKALWIIHAIFLGIVHRYVTVIAFGLEAMSSGKTLDYQRYYQQQSDVAMLRLFDSFLEAAPQLVFQLYVVLTSQEKWWLSLSITSVSAIASMVSLGWGIAAYSSALRMVRTEKNKMTWTGMIFQTVWRFGMLSARIVALVLLALALNEWIIIVLFVHWLLMTLWVIWQNTDFCSTLWEERLYNAIVGVIYCFCFFNLKEGHSRYRAGIFYCIIIAENFAFVSIFYTYLDEIAFDIRFAIGGYVIVGIGTIIGLSAMLLYYGFYHPAGPLNPCLQNGEYKEDEESQEKEVSINKSFANESNNVSRGPDFEIEDIDASSPPPKRPPRRRVQYSRSFKDVCPPINRYTAKVRNDSENKASVVSGSPNVPDSAYGTDSSSPPPTMTDSKSKSSPAFNNDTYMSIDENPPDDQLQQKKKWGNHADSLNNSSRSSQNNNNNLTDSVSEMSQCSAESKITVIEKKIGEEEPDANANPERLLKRSPIMKDVTSSGFAQVMSVPSVVNRNKPPVKEERTKPNKLAGPLTIIIPNISHQAFARSTSPKPTEVTITAEEVNPTNNTSGLDKLSTHDYENLALININRAPLTGNAISHWRTYSDMTNGKHDESTSYDKQKKKKNPDYSNYGSSLYYDIYPLSKELKTQLYRSLTPVSTTATVNSDVNNDSDTYEPIETYCLNPPTSNNAPINVPTKSSDDHMLPVTLIHHDGQKMMTKQIVSLDNLKDVLQRHETIPMDDPQDRGDLYLLAPVRLLTPIIEESEHDTTTKTDSTYHYQPVNRSILTVISDMLNTTPKIPGPSGPPLFPDGRFPESIESTSSLVHTIEEIRNNSLCNLYFSSFTDLSQAEKAENVPAPQVPPRNNSETNRVLNSKEEERNIMDTARFSKVKNESPKPALQPKLNSSSVYKPIPNPMVNKVQEANPVYKPIPKRVHESESFGKPGSVYKSVPNPENFVIVPNCTSSPKPGLPVQVNGSESPKPTLFEKQKSPYLSNSQIAGSRKNILELAGDTANTILNTPKRPPSKKLSFPSKSRFAEEEKENQQQHHTPLHPSNPSSIALSPSSKYETPTPPLRPNQFVRNSAYNRPRRKFSILRDKFEEPSDRNQDDSDLYQNVSDGDLLSCDLSQISKSVSTPSFIDSKDFELRPDEKYENLHRGWATSSTRYQRDPGQQPIQRHEANRRSISVMLESAILANNLSYSQESPPPVLGPKPKFNSNPNPSRPVLFRSHNQHSLSPRSKIFNRNRND